MERCVISGDVIYELRDCPTIGGAGGMSQVGELRMSPVVVEEEGGAVIVRQKLKPALNV